MSEQGIIRYRDSVFTLIGDSETAHYIQAANYVQCVPLTDTGMVIFIHQYFPIFAQPLLTLPSGHLNAQENPAQAANRQLQQGIGFYANQIDFLGKLHPWSQYLEASTYLYLARHLSPSSLYRDEHAEITTELVALDHFERLIESGHLHDSTMIAGLYMARHFIQDRYNRISPGSSRR